MALKSHSLDPQTVKELHNELPRCSVIAQEWQDRVFPAGDSGGEAREPQTVGELLEANRLILDTVGNLIDTCPDQELLREVKKTLIPIQRGEAAAQPLFCPTMDEVDEYYEGQLAPESGQLQL